MKNINIIENINVFISHNKKDKKVAREIALFLVAEDISVWFDEWEVNAGDSIIEEINTGLSGCTHFLILWSKNSAKSNWVKKELSAILSKAIQNGVPRIIPILLDDKKIPELLSDIKYIKYSNGSEEDRKLIINSITGMEPSQNLIKAIVKKYNEVIYDFNSKDPLPFLACPSCGSNELEHYSPTDYKNDEIYFMIKCKDCGWSDWTQ